MAVNNAVMPVLGLGHLSRVEAPITLKGYLICAFAAFGGICKLPTRNISYNEGLS